MMKKIRVLVVDDSPLVREVVSEILSSSDNLEVVATAADPYEARDKIKQCHPDVLTLDIEMPRMDGITFLKNLMRLHPLPVVMLSTLTQKGADETFEALGIGAVDYLPKPAFGYSEEALRQFQTSLVEKVTMAASLKGKLAPYSSDHKIKGKSETGKPLNWQAGSLIAIGASTGGTEAIKDVLLQIPASAPPVVITQHIPAGFSARFAARLNSQCELSVKEAEDGDVLKGGHAYVAPGGAHLKIERSGGLYVCRLDRSAPVNRHIPSVEVMFHSIQALKTKNCVSVLLTGMGEDGAKAMLSLRQSGVHTIAQDKESSLIWGMPGAAVACGAAEEVLPLSDIADKILSYFSQGVTV